MLPAMGSLRTVNPHPGSTDCFEFIRAKLENRRCTHTVCPQQVETMVLPKRVISLADLTGTIRLLKPLQGQTGKYTALSHYWRAHQPIRTTLSSLSSMKLAIPWTSLTSVFKDAIRVCKEAGITFLWIDSLCIVQDSVPD